MSNAALDRGVKRPKAPRYRWLDPQPKRWGHALAWNMSRYEFQRHLVPMDEALKDWDGEIGSYTGFRFIESVPKPRIYPGKRWARP